MKPIFFAPTLAFLALLSACAPNNGANSTPAIKKDAQIESQVEKTLKRMTLEEKAGQMVQITLDIPTTFGTEINDEALDKVIGQYKVGSILNVCAAAAHTTAKMAEYVTKIQEKSMETMGIPCLYGLDMIHGTTYYVEGTFFPQEVNLGATFNPEYARAMGECIGYETRAGLVPWVFSPVMDLTRNPAWPRNYESYGEDPYLQSVMASTETLAIQGDDPNHIDTNHCAVSIKHFMAYGAPVTGKDRTPAIVAENDLREKFFAPFKACIEAGALTAMVNSACINGIPTHANSKLLQGWLKEGLNWDGFLVTDWADIDNLYTRDHLATDKKDAIRIGINAGIDMIMDPYDVTACDLICELVREGKISQARVDDAVRRVLRAKYRLGLFDEPTWDVSGYDMQRPEFVEASKAAAAESEVLLKNEGILPLSTSAKILVTGPNANSIRTLNGGWSYTWQGSDDPRFVERYNTIAEALTAKFGNVRYVPGVEYKGENWQNDEATSIAAAVAAARSCDVVVACIGENTYCETPGNIDDLNISANQTELVKALAATGKPIVLVLNEGRPRIIRDIEPLADAIVDIILPGNYGADALAELLCGEQNFSGKLPFTYPKYVNSLHTYDYKVSEHREVMDGMYNYDAVMDVQWPFGAGLSYTSFEYSNLTVSQESFGPEDVLKFTLNVTNTGSVAGKESILLFSSDLVASLMPDVKRLRAFSKVELKPGESTTVELEVPARSLAFVNAEGSWTIEEGDFRFAVGGQSVMAKCNTTKIWKEQNIQ